MCRNAEFACMIGQEIPVHWRCGEHFCQSHSNEFSVGEVVVAFRSNGTRTFGVILKVEVGDLYALILYTLDVTSTLYDVYFLGKCS